MRGLLQCQQGCKQLREPRCQTVKVLLQQEGWRRLCTASRADRADGDSPACCGILLALPCLAALLLTGRQGYCIAHYRTLATGGTGGQTWTYRCPSLMEASLLQHDLSMTAYGDGAIPGLQAHANLETLSPFGALPSSAPSACPGRCRPCGMLLATDLVCSAGRSS